MFAILEDTQYVLVKDGIEEVWQKGDTDSPEACVYCGDDDPEEFESWADPRVWQGFFCSELYTAMHFECFEEYKLQFESVEIR